MKMYVTRTMFCQKCYDAHFPKLRQKFFVWSKSQAAFVVHEADSLKTERGFTPHTIVYDPAHNEKAIVEIRAYCSMFDVDANKPNLGCGIVITYPLGKDGGGQVNFNTDEIKLFKLPQADWKALRLNSDLGYSLD